MSYGTIYKHYVVNKNILKRPILDKTVPIRTIVPYGSPKHVSLGKTNIDSIPSNQIRPVPHYIPSSMILVLPFHPFVPRIQRHHHSLSSHPPNHHPYDWTTDSPNYYMPIIPMGGIIVPIWMRYQIQCRIYDNIPFYCI